MVLASPLEAPRHGQETGGALKTVAFSVLKSFRADGELQVLFQVHEIFKE